MFLSRSILRFSFLWLCFSASAMLASPAKIDFSSLEKVAVAELKEKNIPGAAIAIVSGEKIIFAKGFGVASVETGAPVTTEMLFRLGSTTKMFTCAALVALAEAGKLKLDAPLSQYITGLQPKIGRVTAQQLMSHTAGLRDEAPMYGLHDETALAQTIRGWKENQFFTEPGKIYSYSNPGFWLAGFVVAEASGKFYADAMNEIIFAPLGMERTTFRPTAAMTYPLALGHDLSKNKSVVVRPFADNAASWPAGSIFSSVNDLSRFVIAFLNDGKIDGQQILSPSLIAQLSSPHADIPGEETKYGYGLNLSEHRGVRFVSHIGSRSGYGSLIRLAPEQHFGLIILANLTGAQLPKTAEKAMEIFLPLEPKKKAVSKRAQSLSVSEMGEYAGAYSNGSDRELIFFEGGKLFLKRGLAKMLLKKTGALRFQTEKNNGEDLVFVPKAGGHVEYLFRNGRTLKKEPAK